MKFAAKYEISDYIGKQIFNLKVVGVSDEVSKTGEKQWEFECVCGKVIARPPSRVISGHVKSCGCTRYNQENNPRTSGKINPKKTDFSKYIGCKNNRLTVLSVHRQETGGRARLECVCDCGKTVFIYPYQFDSGSVLSCGCARFGHSDCHKGNTSRRTHNLTKSRFYKKWNDMIRRCYNQNEPAYRWYGRRGITVCDDWRETPEKFIEWCELTHPNQPGFTLDRIDGRKGYSPENCRWITQQEQVHNLKNNRFVTINGETHCVTEWFREYGISSGAVYRRVHNGQSFEQAIKELIEKKSASVE